MMQFKAFKPSGMEKIARSMGYQGDMGGFQDYLATNPAQQQQMDMYTNKAMQMAKGGMVKKFSNGGDVGEGDVNPFKLGGRQSFYRVPVGKGGPEQEFKKIYIGTDQDTMENRQLGSSSFASATQDMIGQPQAVNREAYIAALQGGPQTPVVDEAPENVQTGTPESSPTNEFFNNAQLQPNLGTPGDATVNKTNYPYLMNTQYMPLNQGYAAAAQAYQNQILGSNSISGYPAGHQPPQQVVPVQNFGKGAPVAPNYADYLNSPEYADTRGKAAATVISPVEVGGVIYNLPNPLQADAYIKYMNRINQNQQGQQAVAVQNFAVGGSVTNPQGTQAATPVAVPATNVPSGQPEIGQFTVEQMYQPGVPVGGTTIAAETPYNVSQDLAAGTGELTGKVGVPTAMALTAQAQQPTTTAANLMQADTVAADVDAAISATQAAQANPQDPRAQVTAAQQTTSSVSNLSAAQGNAFLINNPVQRQLQNGELISGTGVDAAKAAALTAQTQAAAATANPSQQTMVANQLDGLMQQFQGGQPPAWAAGAMRSATAAMAARGMGASSLAGQAIVQAAMESAMPIAMADAQTVAKFESQNLSNRQQSAMLAAEQRAKFMGQEFDQTFQTKVMNASKISDIANQNFTAEQQVQLENSRAVNTMNLNNLSNSQALVMAEASALAQLDTANLSNRQQSAVQNAKNFLQVDMANLSNKQQTELFKGQQRTQALFTDQAATNAAAQFNASSQNQVDQFFASLGSQVSQFNATQQNAQSQFNAGQTNTVARFNAELNNQRDQFNASNQLVIAQANAQWRRQIATADTAAVNRANELNANAILDISKQAYSNLWNLYGDSMEWAWTSAENQIDRVNALAIAELDASTRSQIASEQSSTAAGNAVGNMISTFAAAAIFCWVAREVYGNNDMRWFVFRAWLKYEAPLWFNKLYLTHGKKYAKFISNKPLLKWCTKQLMDLVVERRRNKINVQTI